MNQERTFYNRYWNDRHIKVNPFDEHPGEWTRDNFKFHADFFLPYMKGRLLDYGCGDGQFLNMAKEFSGKVCGVDVSSVAIEKASKAYPEIPFVLLEGDKLPFAEGSFDTISVIDVLEHLLDVETALEEMNRVLAPNGCLLIATSELTRLKMMLISLAFLDKYFFPSSPHIRYFTRKSLAQILNKKGFEVVAYKKNRTYFGFIPQGQLVVARKKS